MVKRAHHRSMVRRILTGALGTLGALAVTTQIASANSILVKVGDTVWKIAQENKTSVKALENANPGSIKKISNSVDLIYAGQRLNLPGTTEKTMADADANGFYTVAPGDTLSKIAQHFGLSVATLKNLNGLTSDQLYIGQRLLVTVSTTSAVSAPAQQATAISSATVNDQENTFNQRNTSSSVPVTTITLKAAVTNNTTNNENGVAMSSDVATPADTNASTITTTTTDQANNTTTQSSSSTSAAPINETSVNTQMINAATTNSANSSAQSAVTLSTSSASTNYQVSTNIQSNSGVSSQVQSVESQQPVQMTSSTTTTTTVSSTATPSLASNSVASTAPATQPQSFTTSTGTFQSQSSTNVDNSVAEQPVSQSQQLPAPSQAQSTATQAQSSATAVTSNATHPQNTTNNDLNSGSVVSLATKIANSNSVPYVWGGASLNGMDCSGLVDYVYAHAEGKQLPHNTVALESCVNQHSVNQAQAGDILFWGQHGATYHSAIYIGNNQFVAAAKPGTNVATYTISKYFMPSFAGTVK